MHRFGLCLTAILMIFGGAAAARDLPSCASPIYLDDIPPGTLPDRIVTPAAMPGAFGGDLECVFERVDGQVVGFFAEFVEFGDRNFKETIIYRETKIVLRLRLADEEEAFDLVTCSWNEDRELTCSVDLFFSEELTLYRYFDSDLNLDNAILHLDPAGGLMDPDLILPYFQDVPTEDRYIAVSFVGTDNRWLMRDLEEGRGYGLFTPEMYDVLPMIYDKEFDLFVDYGYRRDVNGQTQTISSDRTVPTGNIGLALQLLGRVEHLMDLGFEGSRDTLF